MKDKVKAYYGKILKKSADLKTSACCTDSALPAYLKKALSNIHGEVLDKFYGCGLIAPVLLEGAHVLDLGCGAGRDCYVLAQLTGENGFVTGIDMTEEQLSVANKYVDFHAEKFGYAKPNTEFRKGYIEKLDELGIADESIDIIVSNCVINLSPDKESVLNQAYRVLKTGGELYFSDVYADRRIPSDLMEDPVLYGECLSGALYWNDFLRLAKKAGFDDPRLVEDRPIHIDNPAIEKKLGHINFYSATYRLFKLPGLESDCEDYGQSVTYKGSVPLMEDVFELDKEHKIGKGGRFAVCGNTWRMLAETRFKEHFDFHGDFSEHMGLFDCCGQSIPFDTDVCCESGGACCTPLVEIREAEKNTVPKTKNPGYIQPHALKELWFHTGTICNLNCRFCFEDSGPGDNRIEKLTFADAKPYIDEAISLGVQRFSFTGGEPFIVKDLVKILNYALDHRPCLVLTNGTDPLLKQLDAVHTFKTKPHSLQFRISLDYPDADKHDKGRGQGNFEKAVQSLQALYNSRFEISIARQFRKGEDTEAVESEFRKCFITWGLPESTVIIAFPDLLKPGSEPDVPKISEDCMTRYHSEESRKEFMCAYSKMVVKKDGKTGIYPCTLVDDDDAYNLSTSLKEAMEQRIMLSHHRCFSCFSSGVCCSG